MVWPIMSLQVVIHKICHTIKEKPSSLQNETFVHVAALSEYLTVCRVCMYTMSIHDVLIFNSEELKSTGIPFQVYSGT